VRVPSEVGGYVLAGGRSSRMGSDKALVELGGQPLIRHAVTKLRRACIDVRILGSNPVLEAYAPLVPDLRPGCGPLSGLEAALTQSVFDWNLFLPVDMPFLPSAFLESWVRQTLLDEKRGARVAMFTVDGIPQPALALIHRDVLPFVVEALESDQLKLFPVLERAGKKLAERQGMLVGHAFRNMRWGAEGQFSSTGPMYGLRQEPWRRTTKAQEEARNLWFSNINTPEELALAEGKVGALDT
jgi:molybdopterin-guanine dinucleotide biosynthesis protein A